MTNSQKKQQKLTNTLQCADNGQQNLNEIFAEISLQQQKIVLSSLCGPHVFACMADRIGVPNELLESLRCSLAALDGPRGVEQNLI